MNLDEFLKRFEEELEDIGVGTLTATTRFHEIVEWDSMSALVIMAMIDVGYFWGAKIVKF